MSNLSTCNQQGDKELSAYTKCQWTGALNVEEQEPISLPQPDDYYTLDAKILDY